jgi:hypothetical protein
MKILSRPVFRIVLVALVFFATTNVFLAHDDEVQDNKEIIVLLHGLGRSETSM